MDDLTLQRVARWVGVTHENGQRVTNFQHDSRQITKGSLFFALPGERVDGHLFLHEVLEKGGVGAVVAKSHAQRIPHLPCIEVENVLEALQKIATEVHARRQMDVVGVTGSCGKTTTKEYIATLLEGRFLVGKTPGNANSQVGLPLSVLNARGDELFFVAEMGMSQEGEIARLVQIAPPRIALLTNVALAHAQFFSDGLAGIARAKAEIFSHPRTEIAVLSAQAQALLPGVLRKGMQKIVYGLQGSGAQVELCRKDHQTWYVDEEGVKSPPFELPFSASHFCENFLGAAVVARAVGMEWEEIVLQIPRLTHSKHRFHVIERDGVCILDDTYNANPASMGAALRNLPSPKGGGKRIAVLGEMKELGAFTESSHLAVGQIAVQTVDYLLCLGKACQPMVTLFCANGRPAELFEEREAVAMRLKEVVCPGDVIVFKGSNSLKMWLIIESLLTGVWDHL